MGVRHGIEVRQDRDRLPGERAVGPDMGGEIEAFLERIAGKQIPEGYGLCPHGPMIEGWLGIPHDGGLTDAKGEKYWLFVECDECGYQASFQKVERRVNMIAEIPPG